MSEHEDEAQASHLSDVERKMLEFEKKFWVRDSAKEELIRSRFSMSPVSYYQKLNFTIKKPEALEEFPMTVSRLLRISQQSRW